MIKEVWSCREKKVRKFMVAVKADELHDEHEVLSMLHETFMLEFPYRLLLDVSEISLSEDAKQCSIKTNEKFQCNKDVNISESVQYAYDWCKNMGDSRLPSVDCYSDVSHSSTKSDLDSGFAASILQLLRKEHRTDCLNSIENFNQFCLERVEV